MTHIKGRHFFWRKPHHIYINRTALKAQTKFFIVIYSIFLAVWKILSKMCGHVTYYYIIANFCRKNWMILIADKNRLADRIEKIKYSMKYYNSRAIQCMY